MRPVVLIGGLALGAVIGAAGCNRPGNAVAVAEAAQISPTDSGEVLGVAYAQDEGGKLARERLTATRQELAESPPAATAPRPWRTAKLEQPPTLPLVPIVVSGRAVGGEASASTSQKSNLTVHQAPPDVPPLAATEKTPLPARPAQPTGPKVAATGPDPLEMPPLPLSPRLAETATPAADPTADASRQATMAAITWIRVQTAPFLRLVIPDPFELLETARLRNPPPERIEPSAPASRPALPPWPAK